MRIIQMVTNTGLLKINFWTALFHLQRRTAVSGLPRFSVKAPKLAETMTVGLQKLSQNERPLILGQFSYENIKTKTKNDYFSS